MDFDRFGSGVTVIEWAPGLIAREDADVSEAVTAILKNERIDVHVETKCLLVERHGRDMESVAGSPSGIVIRKLRDGGHLVSIRERDPATGARPRVSSSPAQ